MPSKTIPLKFGSTPIEAIEWGEQTYLRVEQLVHPFGVGSDRAIMMCVSRHSDLFREGDMTKLPLETGGGKQDVSVISWQAALKVSGLLTTKKARKFNAWLTDVFLGYQRASGRADGSMLRSMGNPFEIGEHPMFALGVECWHRAAAIEAEAKQRAKDERMRAERLWSNIGVTRKQGRILIEARAVFTPPAQPSLPLLEG